MEGDLYVLKTFDGDSQVIKKNGADAADQALHLVHGRLLVRDHSPEACPRRLVNRRHWCEPHPVPPEAAIQQLISFLLFADQSA